MSVDSKPRADGSSVGAAESDSRDSAGLLFARLTALPALVLLPLLLVGLPFLLVGYFKPVPVLVLWVALTILVVPYVWRRIPSLTGTSAWSTAAAGSAEAGTAKPTPKWALWALVAVSLAFGAFQAVFHSQFVIVQLDAASYLQYANWISGHGTTLVSENSQYFGGHPSSILYWSAAFFQTNDTSNYLVPQFMSGLPMLLSTAFWAGGMRLALFWGPVLGALAVFTFGGLVARLVGPRWAPFAAAVIGIGIPMAYTSRNTYSEPLALIFLIGGLSLWIDAQRSARGSAASGSAASGSADTGAEDAGPWRANWRHHLRSPSHVLAGVAGLLLGIIFLVRVDGPADIMFVVPYCGLLILRRQRQVYPFMGGLILGTLYGAVDGVFLSLPYLESNKQSVEGMAAAIVLLTIGTAAVLWWLRRRGSELRNPQHGKRQHRKLVNAVTALPVVVVALFAIYPYTVRSHWAGLQYAPLSLHWIYWYTGIAAIVLAVLGYAILGRRAVKGAAPAWVLPLLVFGCATLVFLLRPGITPHQPYASRRLVPAVLPGVILLATWTICWLAERSQVIHLVDVPDFLKRAARPVVTVVCSVAIFLPPLFGNFGLSLSGPDADGGLALTQVYAGEISIVDKLCAVIPKGTSVLVIDHNTWWEFGQDIRGMCNVPDAGVQTTPATIFPVDDALSSTPAQVVAAVQAVISSGHTPFVIAANKTELAPVIKAFGNASSEKFIMSVETSIDEHTIIGAPHNPVTQRWTAYSWEPGK